MDIRNRKVISHYLKKVASLTFYITEKFIEDCGVIGYELKKSKRKQNKFKTSLSNFIMIPPTEKNLRNHISKERMLEMEKYGRIKTYDQIHNFLRGNEKTAFSLINHALAIVDDEVDRNTNKKQIDKVIIILTSGFRKTEILLNKDWEKDIFRLGQVLSRSHKNNPSNAILIFNEVIKYWEVEKENINRRGKILNSHDLDKLNLEIGKSVGVQFLYFLCPYLGEKVRERIALLYGFAIKLADNLSDLDEDLKRGYINISKEKIKKYGINLTNLSEKNLQSYIKEEFKRVKLYYKKGDKVVEEILKKYPSSHKGILIFKEIAHSWLKQVSEIAFIQELRQLNITNYSILKFLSGREMLEMENFYGINLSDITTLSYKQEAINTHIIRKKNPKYNPYSHEKTPQANEKIRKLISIYPKIKNILDLGCDNGSRTINLFSGKKLYGIETAERAVEDARKRGLAVYNSSMIKDMYKDNRNPQGRKFDLVSLVGEMVNFVGLDVNNLLANSIKQVKDKGYFLVSCMHSKFDKAHEGNYVVWSFTKSTEKKWFLKEKKIPRTFFLISKQGLLKKIKKIAEEQNCNLILKNEEVIKNYYKDMLLEIYIFQKNLK